MKDDDVGFQLNSLVDYMSVLIGILIVNKKKKKKVESN